MAKRTKIEYYDLNEYKVIDGEGRQFLKTVMPRISLEMCKALTRKRRGSGDPGTVYVADLSKP